MEKVKPMFSEQKIMSRRDTNLKTKASTINHRHINIQRNTIIMASLTPLLGTWKDNKYNYFISFYSVSGQLRGCKVNEIICECMHKYGNA